MFVGVKNNTDDSDKLNMMYTCKPSTSRMPSDTVANAEDEDLKALALFLDAEDVQKPTKAIKIKGIIL